MTTVFTWGKAIGYQSSDDGGLDFYINQRPNYARADFDRKYAYSQSSISNSTLAKAKQYLGSGPESWVLGGWQLSVSSAFLRERRWTFTANSSSLNTPGETQTADQVSAVTLPRAINSGDPWFSLSSFAQPTGVRFGTSGRNILSRPGLFALNASLSKSFRITKRLKADIRSDRFN